MQSLLKFPKQEKSALLPHLVDLMQFCWKEGWVPQDMRDAMIVTLFINKGDRNYCNNYRRISLLSIVGKIFARVVLTRIQVLDKRAYPESQCGFRPGKSTIDNFLWDNTRKMQRTAQPLYLAFVHLAKACYFVSRNGLFKIIQKIGCPPF